MATDCKDRWNQFVVVLMQYLILKIYFHSVLVTAVYEGATRTDVNVT